MTMAMILEGINYLASIAKTRDLTEAEEILREELRGAYLALIRQAFRKQIEGVKLVDETGADVTPEKLKAVQKEKGLHGRDQDLPTRMAKFLSMLPDVEEGTVIFGEVNDLYDDEYDEEFDNEYGFDYYEEYNSESEEYNEYDEYDDEYDE
ncbi:Uncharacterized protein YnzC, UPF0291/DUF896 family [Globicatella sulfidifaciens DSM 15739]|uniref:UPF0291 protein SAMN02746011_01944 n=1 Tax=Globicatella sulfidifaciens DSM 15739 TaxID=1121925 RepID=A0A1T4P3U1_9LACT|nr:Uncharacterized protein YnzC, UPF0291/DUF896 family [Globicatella sulfidifaciens DSM 15739]